jgi:hypothetical protein
MFNYVVQRAPDNLSQQARGARDLADMMFVACSQDCVVSLLCVTEHMNFVATRFAAPCSGAIFELLMFQQPSQHFPMCRGLLHDILESCCYKF